MTAGQNNSQVLYGSNETGKMLQILRLRRNRLDDLTSEYSGFPPTNIKDRLKRKC